MRTTLFLILSAGLALSQQAAPPARGGFGNAGFVPNPTYDKDPPKFPDGLKSGGVLIFSKTSGYRDEPAMQASNAALAAIAQTRGWPFFVTENGAVMNEQQLSRFKVVVWNNTSGDTLDAAQKEVFKAWMEKGGSFVGIHGAGGDPVGNYGHSSATDWKWLVDTLIGAQFTVHSTVMPGEIHIEDPKSPIARNLPALWPRAEEWYAFSESPRAKPGFHVIATVDEKSYTPGRATMGADHPMIWWHCVGNGHAVYSALGHAGRMYAEPEMIQLLDNMIAWGLAQNARACVEKK